MCETFDNIGDFWLPKISLQLVIIAGVNFVNLLAKKYKKLENVI